MRDVLLKLIKIRKKTGSIPKESEALLYKLLNTYGKQRKLIGRYLTALDQQEEFILAAFGHENLSTVAYRTNLQRLRKKAESYGSLEEPENHKDGDG